MSNPKLCSCNSNKTYLICCAPYHKGKIYAPTAEALMRSRFSAYVINNIQYIYRTWDTETRPPLKVLREDNNQVFTQLEILNCTKGNINEDTGTVEFIASYFINNEEFINKKTNKTTNNITIKEHQENSYFVKKNGKWKYVNELSKIDTNEIN